MPKPEMLRTESMRRGVPSDENFLNVILGKER
jgi:hypothetical protein